MRDLVLQCIIDARITPPLREESGRERLAVVTIATGEWDVLSCPPLELPVTVQPTSTGGGCSPEEEGDERKGRWERGEEKKEKEGEGKRERGGRENRKGEWERRQKL